MLLAYQRLGHFLFVYQNEEKSEAMLNEVDVC